MIDTTNKSGNTGSVKKVSDFFSSLPEEQQKILNGFGSTVQGIYPLTQKQKFNLPMNIRELSRQLTDRRSERNPAYMNSPAQSFAYIHYFMWWNLVRFVHLLHNLEIELDDGDYALDLGSGPLTMVTALWIAKPELRNKKITWYTLDVSMSTMSRGEEIFYAVCSETLSTQCTEPWKIIKIKGGMETKINHQVKFLSCANMFNEVFWNAKEKTESIAASAARRFTEMTGPGGKILVIEPGIPPSGKFISLLRGSLMKRKAKIISPCPHQGECPMKGDRGGKWCHFVFDGNKAPENLKKLSKLAKLEKERISLSFVFAEKCKTEPEPSSFGELKLRVISDKIKLPDFKTGRYCCSACGLVILSDFFKSKKLEEINSGTLLSTGKEFSKKLDPKTGAFILDISGNTSKKYEKDMETFTAHRKKKDTEKEQKKADSK